MKFTITMKDPDGVYESIEDVVSEIVVGGLDSDELSDVRERRRVKIHELCRTWFEYGEYLRVEIDTEAQTCTVLPVGRKP